MPLILTARNTAPGRPQSTAALSIPQRPWNGWSMDHFFGGKNHGKSPWKNHCLLGRRGTCYMWHVQKLPVRCNMRAYPRPCWEPTFFARCGPIQRKPSWDGQTVSREAKSGMGKTAVFVLACLQNLEISKSVGSQVTRRLWIGDGWSKKQDLVGGMIGVGGDQWGWVGGGIHLKQWQWMVWNRFLLLCDLHWVKIALIQWIVRDLWRFWVTLLNLWPQAPPLRLTMAYPNFRHTQIIPDLTGRKSMEIIWLGFRLRFDRFPDFIAPTVGCGTFFGRLVGVESQY